MTSSSSRLTSRTALPLSRSAHDLPVDVFDGADVQAAGGLHRHQQLGVFVDLAGDDGLLLVAAGHAAHDGGAALTAADVVLRDELIGVLADLLGLG